jgi:hypothetical protein
MACNAPSLASDASATFKLEATPPTVGIGGRYVNMSAAAATETDDPDASNDSAQASVFVDPPLADLSIAIQRTGVVSGSIANFRVPVSNAGPNDSVGVSVSITSNLIGTTAATIATPPGWTCVRVRGTRMRIDCEPVTFNMPQSVTETIRFSVMVPRNMSFYVNADVHSTNTGDPNPSNDTATYTKP